MTVSIFGTHEKRGSWYVSKFVSSDFAVLEVHFLGEAVAEPHREAAFHLLRRALGIDDDAHVLRGEQAHDLDRARSPCPPSPRPCWRSRCPRRCRSATPTPRPLGPGFGVQPNAFAAASARAACARRSRFIRRNSTGSMPAFAAMMSMCDSRANALAFAPGARHGPDRRTDAGPAALPRHRSTACGGSGCRRSAPRRASPRRTRCSPRRRSSCRVDARADREHGGRIERVVEELLFAAPHDAHRHAGGHREARRFDALLRRALAAEPAADVRRDDAHLVRPAAPSADTTCDLSGNGDCVPAHTVTLPFSTAATAECVSIGACAT